MCGIAGIVDKEPIEDVILIKKMTDRIKHRGPDDEGFLAFNTKSGKITLLTGKDSRTRETEIENFADSANVLLGHRRLSIIDLSEAGHQPMRTEDGKTYIIYNGEIYNYIEIRKELESKGYTFKTATDTEVILKSYLKYGFDCVNKFNGMWAFAILDTYKNLLFISRDLPGVKPFYYIYKEGKHFLFASETKAFLDLNKYTNLNINQRKVFEYLSFGIVDRDERTFFEEVLELPPGHSAVLDLQTIKLKIWRHRDIEVNTKYEKFDSEKLKNYVQGVRERIFKAVELRLRSDVPIGSCLSGGIDSSTIVMTINELLKSKSLNQIGERQKVFTASFEGTAEDETKWAKLVVEKSNVEWHKTTPTFETLLNDLSDIVYYQDFPFPTTSMYAHYCVMKLVKNTGVTVTLDGQGSDEIFSGYYFHYGPFFAEMVSKFDFTSILNELRSRKNMPLSFSALTKYTSLSLTGKLIPKSLLKFILNFEKSHSLLKPEFIQQNKDVLHEMTEWYKERYSFQHTLNKMLYDTYTRDTLKPILRFADRNSMRFRIEARTPFADDIELVKYAFQIPGIYKIHNGYAKYILREATQNLIPDEIRWRKDKKGFVTPEKKWFMENYDKTMELINSFSNILSNYIDLKSLEKKKIDHSMLWRIINLGMWVSILSNFRMH